MGLRANAIEGLRELHIEGSHNVFGKCHKSGKRVRHVLGKTGEEWIKININFKEERGNRPDILSAE